MTITLRLTKGSALTWQELDDNFTTADLGLAAPDYFTRQCALLDPNCLETAKRGTFTYTVGPNETKFVIASWANRINGGVGRYEIRNPYQAHAVRDCTITGTLADSLFLVMDPTLGDFPSPAATYYQRLQAIQDLPTKQISFDAANQDKALLLGAYGGIITRAVNFNFAWLILRPYGAWGGYNVANELGDAVADYQRNDAALSLALDKRFLSTGASGNAGGVGAPFGTICYVLLPSTWSTIPDPNTYRFRDDFMGTALNTTTTWNRVQSVVGNVEIDTNFQWCKLKGTVGTDSMYSKTTFPRASEPEMIVDIYVPSLTEAPLFNNAARVGWTTGYTANSYAHAVDFTNTGAALELAVWENGVKIDSNVGGYEKGSIYRVSIKMLAAGGAVYKIQGGTYGQIGSSTWETIVLTTPSSGTATPLSVGALSDSNTGPYYISDMRVI